MRIRHYFSQLTALHGPSSSSSYDLHRTLTPHGEDHSPPPSDKKSHTLPRLSSTREKTSQTSPKKPLRSLSRRLAGLSSAKSDQDLASTAAPSSSTSGGRPSRPGPGGDHRGGGPKKPLLSSQSLRISSSVPSLGLAAKGYVEPDNNQVSGRLSGTHGAATFSILFHELMDRERGRGAASRKPLASFIVAHREIVSD